MDSTRFEPVADELPSAYAERLGLLYTQTVDIKHKKEIGQFFTPVSAAEFMASYCHSNKKKIKILDPGAGLGILSCALIEHIISCHPEVTDIDLTSFETDEKIITYTDLSLNYLNQWVQQRGVNISHLLCKNDFILHNSKILDKCSFEETYDLIICNPPYFKIPHGDTRAQAAKNIIYGQSNIYSIFMIVAAKLLAKNGQLIFITPRSFASGEYFRTFREIFFSLVDINYIHVFGSRRNAFERDKVLQENVIVVARKKASPIQIPVFTDYNIVQISSSAGLHDIEDRDVRNYQFSQLVDLLSKQKILHIPTTKLDDDTINIFKTWTGSFDEYNIKISTGPIVDFRNTEFIGSQKRDGYVPLIYLHNVDKMVFTWPLEKVTKNKTKGQYILDTLKTKSLLPNDNYILLRRFSSKDDNSKLVATPYLSKWLRQYQHIGIENHLNYFYRKNARLEISEIYGIAGLLNSRLFDVYFRTFNGNINVSATELKHMPLPPLEQIKCIGKELMTREKVVQEIIDTIVENHLMN